ncbi:hypothetical protein BGZ65_003761 [Modicella reniformis]|uniref:Uncharacterized protein n=1 Tax=Modicella reniformis TaxID=1440133 RepID=A0A9P6SN03_9FUNG|nr:hypothetical protein BGZ65_003761 [Modicella reniformis]
MTTTAAMTKQDIFMISDLEDGVLGVSLLIKKNGDKNLQVETIQSGEQHPTTTATTTIEYPTLAPLGPAMQITRCRGNIILELDESNATRLLLDHLQATTLSKDKEYFLATGELSDAEQGQDVNINMSKATVYKITGGDPGKGNMAVDTVHDLNIGQWVQFIHHNRKLSHGHHDASLNNSSQESLRFTATDPNNTIEEIPEEHQRQQHQLSGEDKPLPFFGGSSENGFIVGQTGEQTWVCNITDSVMKHNF